MRRLQLKKHIAVLLAEKNIEDVQEALGGYRSQDLISPLISAFCNPIELVRWRSITVFGWVVSRMVNEDPEAARIVMRRLLWSLNDESGGIGWGAPEAMAEVMCRSTLLRQEYLHMLLSYMREDGDAIWQDGNFLELPMLQIGLLWGAGRLCSEYPELMREKGAVGDIQKYFSSIDIYVVAMALRCFCLLGEIPEETICARLRGNCATMSLYENGQLYSVSLDEIAARCLNGLPKL